MKLTTRIISDNFTINVVTRADLDVNLTSAAGVFTTQVAPNLVYVVTAKNTGDAAAPNLLVKSTLPKDVAFVRVEENQLGTCLQNSTDSSGALQVNCTLSSLAAGASGHVRILGKITGSIPDGTKVTFATNVDPNNTVPERNNSNNTAFMLTTVRAPSEVQITGHNCNVPGLNSGQTFVINSVGIPDLDNRNASAKAIVDSGNQLFDAIVANNSVTLRVCGAPQ